MNCFVLTYRAILIKRDYTAVSCDLERAKRKGDLYAKRDWLVRVESRRYASKFCKAAQTS